MVSLESSLYGGGVQVRGKGCEARSRQDEVETVSGGDLSARVGVKIACMQIMCEEERGCVCVGKMCRASLIAGLCCLHPVPLSHPASLCLIPPFSHAPLSLSSLLSPSAKEESAAASAPAKVGRIAFLLAMFPFLSLSVFLSSCPCCLAV